MTPCGKDPTQTAYSKEFYYLHVTEEKESDTSNKHCTCGSLTSAKEVALNSSENEPQAPRGPTVPHLTGAAVSTWLHMEPGIAAEQEGTPG